MHIWSPVWTIFAEKPQCPAVCFSCAISECNYIFVTHFKDLLLQQEPMGYGLISIDRVKKSESAERTSNKKSDLVFSEDVLRNMEILYAKPHYKCDRLSSTLTEVMLSPHPSHPSCSWRKSESVRVKSTGDDSILQKNDHQKHICHFYNSVSQVK